MKRRKLIILAAITILISFSVSVFAWFYFPNSKGLEIDTAPALDFDISVYKLINNYDEDGNYTSSSLIDLDPTTTTYSSYLDSDAGTFTIPEEFEFYQWGDEFICEDTDPHYYALEISYDSDAYSDGYIKGIIDATLASSGSFIVDEGEATETTYDASFPVIKTSYKYASYATIMATEADALTEMKSSSGYKEIINGTYYYTTSDSGATYNVVDRSVAYDSNTTYYTCSDLARAYGVTSTNFSSGTYYTLSNHVLTKATAYDSTATYYSGTFTETTITGYATTNASYSLTNLNYQIETSFKDDLTSTQYLINSTKYIKFVLFIKIEPDETLVTNKMDQYEDFGDLTEINVTNTLTLDVMLRSMPHVSGTLN